MTYEENEGWYMPLQNAMLWSSMFQGLHNDVCQPPDLRRVSFDITGSCTVFAAHWAGHQYARRCIFEEMPHLFGPKQHP